MFFFDMRNVLVCYSLISLTCTIVMAQQWRRYRNLYTGLGFWCIDYALQCLGLIFIMLRGSVPDILSLTVGNSMIVAGFVILLNGMQAFFQKKGNKLLDWGIFVVFVAIYTWFVMVTPNLPAREVVFSLVMLLTCVRVIRLLVKLEVSIRSITTGTSSILVAFCLVSLIRIILDLAIPSSNDFFVDTSFDALILVIYMTLFAALKFSLVSMVGQRILIEQRDVIAENNRIEAALRESEKKFFKAFQASPDAITISRLEDDCFIEVNDNFTRISGYSREEALQDKPIEIWGDPQTRNDLVKEINSGAYIKRREIRLIGKTGKVIHVDYSGGLIELHGEKHLLSIFRDLSDRDRSEKILHVRLALRDYSAGHSTEELMIKALDEIEDMTNSRIGFYHFVDEDQGTLSLQAWSTRTSLEFCKAEGKGSHYEIKSAGVWADAIRERKPIIHNDYLALQNRKGMPPGHTVVQRELIAPTLRNGAIIAILGVGNKQTDYTDEDVSLVSYIADLIWTIVVQKRSDEQILKLNDRLEQLAMTDELTGIANRRAFFAFAMRELQKANRYASPVSFIMLDIDYFKQINDTYGHDSGDAVLRIVSDIIRKQVRDVDIAARLGGEEFGILMANTKLNDATLSAERLRAAIEQAVCDKRGQLLKFTVSIGVCAKNDDSADLDDIMRRADEAMYRAKSAGRNRIEFA